MPTMQIVAAHIIFEQIGGHKFIAMTGAKNFCQGSDQGGEVNPYLSFQFPSNIGTRNSINFVKIELTPEDVYDVSFGSLRGTKWKLVEKINGLFVEQLINAIEITTGLYVRL
jgi:hypothetical protein